jgi:N-acetylglutamate synthase and related acetyltransferases
LNLNIASQNNNIANLNSINENSNSGITNSGADIASKNINITTVNSDKKNIANSARLLKLFSLAKDACDKGVERIHILNGSIEGILPCEIFSGIGSGTMIYNSGYGDFRPMLSEDIPSVLSLMKPFVERGILLPRTTESLKCELNNLIVYNVDGGIHGCAALKNYGQSNGFVQAEISAVAVDEAYSNMGVGPKIIAYLLEKARSMKIDSVFVLTTQTADWFQKQGFVPDTIDSIPDERKKIWTPARGSKVYRIKF